MATPGATPDVFLPLAPRLAEIMQTRQYRETGYLDIIETKEAVEARAPFDQSIEGQRHIGAVPEDAAGCRSAMALACLGNEGQWRLPSVPEGLSGGLILQS